MDLKLMGEKVGMTQVFDKTGNRIVCTVISVKPNKVTQVKTKERDGYQAIQLGALKVKSSRIKNLTKPLVGHFAANQIEPLKHLSESKGSVEGIQVGQEFDVEVFADCSYVDITGTSKGKGFQGVIKRHGFAGGPAAHGSGFHRAAGSTGCRTTPGRNFPGGKKAGHMGDEIVTVECLRVIRADKEKGLLLVKGAIPGCKGGLVYIRKSKKKSGKKN